MFRRKQMKPHKENTGSQGSSLIIVVCVSAFLAVFALAMIYTGSLLLSRANRRLEQERCYQLARSFGEVLDKELMDSYTNLLNPGDAGYDEYNASFYRFACYFLEESIYSEYIPSQSENTKFHYRVGGGESPAGPEYGKVTIILYKENNQDTDVMKGTLPFDPAVFIPEGQNNPVETIRTNISRYTFYVEVVAELDGMTYSYSTAYDPRVTYREDAVEFTAGDVWVKWDGSEWRDRNGNPYSVPEGTAIRYEINPGYNMLTNCEFTRIVSQ